MDRVAETQAMDQIVGRADCGCQAVPPFPEPAVRADAPDSGEFHVTVVAGSESESLASDRLPLVGLAESGDNAMHAIRYFYAPGAPRPLGSASSILVLTAPARPPRLRASHGSCIGLDPTRDAEVFYRERNAGRLWVP